MSIIKQLKQRFLPWCLTFILAIASSIFALPNFAYAQVNQPNNSTEPTVSSPRDAFRQAYENRYTWDKNFPGYSAKVSINYYGELDQGTVRINPDLSVQVNNIKREDMRDLIANQLKMEVIHFRRIPFEKMHQNKSFELEGTDKSGAWKIQEVGDEMDSHYKVKNQVITQVNRTMGAVAVTVDTVGTAKTPEGYLVTHFHTLFRDTKTGEVVEKEDVRDFHEKIGKYYLLTNREIRASKEGNPEDKVTADVLIRFNDIQPLQKTKRVALV